MTARIVLAATLVVVALVVAWLLERRRRPEKPAGGRALVPQQVDRADFARPDAPWLVVVWTSRACDSCRGLIDKVMPLASDDVAVVEVEFQTARELHRRYGIEAAPVTIVVDDRGVTRASFAGAFAATDLWGTVAGLREQA
jgi:hypothetical protein